MQILAATLQIRKQIANLWAGKTAEGQMQRQGYAGCKTRRFKMRKQIASLIKDVEAIYNNYGECTMSYSEVLNYKADLA